MKRYRITAINDTTQQQVETTLTQQEVIEQYPNFYRVFSVPKLTSFTLKLDDGTIVFQTIEEV